MGCWWGGCGALVVLVRCLRGSRPAGAVPAGFSRCWCVAAGDLWLLVRCLGLRWGWSPKGASTGSGPVGGLGSRGLASASGRRTILRFCVLDPPLCVRASYRWICNRRNRSAAADPPIAGCRRVSLCVRVPELERFCVHEGIPSRTQNLGPTPCPSHSPRPQTSAVASRPVEALSEATPTPAEAAHQQVETPCGSAPPNPDPLRQRSGKIRTPAGSAPAPHATPPTPHEARHREDATATTIPLSASPAPARRASGCSRRRGRCTRHRAGWGR